MPTPLDNPTVTLRLGDVRDILDDVIARLGAREPLDHHNDDPVLDDLHDAFRRLARVTNTVRDRNNLPRLEFERAFDVLTTR